MEMTHELLSLPLLRNRTLTRYTNIVMLIVIYYAISSSVEGFGFVWMRSPLACISKTLVFHKTDSLVINMCISLFRSVLFFGLIMPWKRALCHSKLRLII